MIRPEGFRAAAFGSASDGDARNDRAVREHLSQRLGIPNLWATVSQVHHNTVVTAKVPGHLGEADGIITQVADLPVAVATADCVPVIVEGAASVVVLHAGWRGLDAGIVAAGILAMRDSGDVPLRAAVGPAIGPCCYEVGRDVADRFAGHVTATTWGAPSVDLPSIAEGQLTDNGVPEVWVSNRCTMTDDDLYSHRRDQTKARQVAVTWLPRG